MDAFDPRRLHPIPQFHDRHDLERWHRDFTVPNYNNSGQTANYPDTIVTLNTGGSHFDRLLVTGNGLAYDTFAVGFGANTAPVPEPSGGLFAMLATLVAAARRRR